MQIYYVYMTKKYSLGHLTFLRYCIPAMGLFFFTVQIIVSFLTKTPENYHWFFYPLIALNCCSVIGCTILLITPDNNYIYGILGMLYTILFAFVDISELSIFICYIISQFAFYGQTYTLKKGLIHKIFGAILLIFVIVVRAIIFKMEFVNRLFNIWPFLFALAVIFLFFIRNENLQEKYKRRTIIDLNQFDELSDRQKDLVIALLNDVKYEDFATEHKVSKSAVKKDAVGIFKVFSTYDKNSFVLKYSSCNFQRDSNIVYKGV